MGEHSQIQRLSNHEREQLKADNIELLPPLSNFSLAKFWRTAQDGLRLHQFIRKLDIDLVHVMFAEPTCLWSWFKPLWRCPCVLTTRGTDILVTIPRLVKQPNWHGKLMSALFRGSMRAFDCLTGTSQRQLDQIRQLFEVDCNKLHLIRTGTQVKDFEVDQSQHLPPSCRDKPYIFFPRYLTPLYNHDFSLDGLELLPQSLQERLRFVFVGSDGHDRAYVSNFQARLKTLGQLDCVVLPRLNRESLIAAYQGAELVIMNPISDGTPVSGIETMLAKTPLILGPLDYDPDLFNPRTCHQLQEWSPQALARLIESSLVGQPEMIESAYTIARELADAEREVGRLEKIYQSLFT
jgi:hypothetical protein